MERYIIRRILILFPTLIAIIFIIYGILDLTPGDPARLILGLQAPNEAVEALRIEMGLDKPFIIRFFNYALNAFQGDLGTSWRTGQSVFEVVISRFPTTIKLAFGAMVIAVSIGIPLGILAAVKQYSFFDAAGTIFAMILAAVPGFWLGMMLIVVFALKLGLLPSFGTDSFAGFILPWITMSTSEMAALLRLTRTTMLETIRQDYVRTARAKGQRERVVIFDHALKNALLPVVTVTGTQFCSLLAGVVTVETVFSINGVGMMILTAIQSKDIPLITGGAIFLAFAVMLLMLLVDIIYAFIDPRIKARYARKVGVN